MIVTGSVKIQAVISPGIWWSGLGANRSGSLVQYWQTNSYLVKP
jgi:hypothetical protein